MIPRNIWYPQGRQGLLVNRNCQIGTFDLPSPVCLAGKGKGNRSRQLSIMIRSLCFHKAVITWNQIVHDELAVFISFKLLSYHDVASILTVQSYACFPRKGFSVEGKLRAGQHFSGISAIRFLDDNLAGHCLYNWMGVLLRIGYSVFPIGHLRQSVGRKTPLTGAGRVAVIIRIGIARNFLIAFFCVFLVSTLAGFHIKGQGDGTAGLWCVGRHEHGGNLSCARMIGNGS